MITYKTKKSPGDPQFQVTVLLDGKTIGAIKLATNGWQYFPKGHKQGGDVFPTLGAVKRSLSND